MSDIDIESIAVHAVSQARLLRHRADLAATAAESQAVALLLGAGMSQRVVAKMTGLSKSDVARRATSSPPLGVAVAPGSDTRVYDFADEWLWGDRQTADRVGELLCQREGVNGELGWD